MLSGQVILMQIAEVDLLVLIGQDVALKKHGNTYGGEYRGPCPWCGGRDRFHVWPKHQGRKSSDGRGRWWCRDCHRKGDAIAYVQQREGVSFREAVGRLGVDMAEMPTTYGPPPLQVHPPILPEDGEAPTKAWQDAAGEFVAEAVYHLWATEGQRARAWLIQQRRLTEETIKEAHLGYNPGERRVPRTSWGLPPDPEHPNLWLPRGVVIPWWIQGELWRVNIRRPLTRKQSADGQQKYIQAPGGSVGLYGADRLSSDRAAVLVEGEFDALLIGQEAGDLVTAVATGSTTGGHRMRWILALARVPLVLVSFDADDAGEGAAGYWMSALPPDRRRHWRPAWEDPTQMARDGVDVRQWVVAGLEGSCKAAKTLL